MHLHTLQRSNLAAWWHGIWSPHHFCLGYSKPVTVGQLCYHRASQPFSGCGVDNGDGRVDAHGQAGRQGPVSVMPTATTGTGGTTLCSSFLCLGHCCCCHRHHDTKPFNPRDAKTVLGDFVHPCEEGAHLATESPASSPSRDSLRPRTSCWTCIAAFFFLGVLWG